MKKILLAVMGLGMMFQVQAQSVDEILDTYFENVGGRDAMNNLTGVKFTAKVNQGGMEIPLEIVQLKDGRQYTKITLQGLSIWQGVFDGETLWNTNFQTQKAEKADAETTENIKRNLGDFPDPLLNYKEKGYTLEYVGKETLEGTDVFKLKLVQNPMVVDGEEVENITYWFFDAENYVPIAAEKEIMMGPQKGAISQTKMSDYQEVEGIYFPFTMTQGIKGGMSQPIMIDSIILNPEVDNSVFTFPEGN